LREVARLVEAKSRGDRFSDRFDTAEDG
jgi:hypothetical protein